MKKDKLRRTLIAERQALGPIEVARRSESIVAQVRRTVEWKNVREALVYWPTQNEVDTRPLITELWQRGARVLLPKCRPGQPGVMDLAEVSCEADLNLGMYNIMEPNSSCSMVDVEAGSCAPDLALVPGVAYDRQGFRLGFGGGYYDRLLGSPQMGLAMKVGLAYSFQFMTKVPTDDWDRPVNAVITEEETWYP